MGSSISAKNYFALTRFKDAAAAVLLGLMTLMPLAGSAFADGVGLPTNVCHDFCGPQQQQMWARFEQGQSPDLAVLPRVYAGVCHVLGHNINPEREHHVGFIIDNFIVDNSTVNNSGGHQLRLRFSFFTAMQPYDELDAAQARENFNDPVLPLSVHDGYAYAEVSDRRFYARYWFRRERERMLLVSYFGDRVTILCDAAANRYR